MTQGHTWADLIQKLHLHFKNYNSVWHGSVWHGSKEPMGQRQPGLLLQWHTNLWFGLK